VGCAIARPLKTAPEAMPVVGATSAVVPPRHALSSPASVAKTKEAGPSAVVAEVAIGKLPATPAKTAPVGPPGTATVSGTFAPAPV
jgi:hypothetical protein